MGLFDILYKGWMVSKVNDVDQKVDRLNAQIDALQNREAEDKYKKMMDEIDEKMRREEKEEREAYGWQKPIDYPKATKEDEALMRAMRKYEKEHPSPDPKGESAV